MSTLGRGWLIVSGCLLCASSLIAEPQLEQKPLTIYGEAGKPKTLYIAPWKKVGEPIKGEVYRSGLKPSSEPLERENFMRELELRNHGYSPD